MGTARLQAGTAAAVPATLRGKHSFMLITSHGRAWRAQLPLAKPKKDRTGAKGVALACMHVCLRGVSHASWPRR